MRNQLNKRLTALLVLLVTSGCSHGSSFRPVGWTLFEFSPTVDYRPCSAEIVNTPAIDPDLLFELSKDPFLNLEP